MDSGESCFYFTGMRAFAVPPMSFQSRLTRGTEGRGESEVTSDLIDSSSVSDARNPEPDPYHRGHRVRLAFDVFGEHFFGVDGDEDAAAAG
jgi:hypothetical protein